MLKRFALVALVLLVVAVLVAVFAATRLDDYVNNNREMISERVSQSLGRTFTFESVATSFRGGIGARLVGIRIADDPAFSKGDFVTAESVNVRVRILPLLRGRVEVAGLTLARPVVELVQTAKGLNMSTLGAAPDTADEQPAGAGAAAVAVVLINIENGSLRYTDKTVSPASVMTIENLQVKATDVDVTRPVLFSMTASVLGASGENLQASGTLGPLNSAEPGLTPISVKATLAGVTTDDLMRAGAVAAALPEGLAVKGPIDATLDLEGNSTEANLKWTLDASRADVAYAAAFAKPAGVALSYKGDARKNGPTITINDSALTLNKAVVKTNGTITSNTDATVYDIAMRASEVDLQGWDKLIAALAGTQVSGRGGIDLRAKGSSGGNKPPQLHGTIALNAMTVRSPGRPALEGLTATLKLAGNTAVVPPTEFKLGGSPVRVDATVSDLAKQTADFTLSSKSLDPASLGFDDGDPKTNEVLNDLKIKGSAVGTPRLAVQATVTAASGSMRGAAFRALAATMHYKDGQAVLQPMQMQAFGGRLEGTARYTEAAGGGRPTFAFDGKVKDVRLPEVFAYAGVPASEQLLDGLLDADFDVRGEGSTWDVIRTLLSGSGRMAVREGTLKDVNLAEAVLGGITGVPGISNSLSPSLRSKYPALFGTKSTTFNELRSGIRIVDGMLRSDDFTLAADDFGLRGNGGYGLDRNVAFNSLFSASKQLSADLIREANALKYLTNAEGRLEIPFELRGIAPRVQAKVDSGFVARAVQKAATGAVTDLLGGALGGRRKQAQPDTQPQAAPSEGEPAGEVK